MTLVKTKTANTSLTIDQVNTFLTSDTASGASTLPAKNITGFAINQILVVGSLGNQGAEIIKSSSVTAPSVGVITLASTTVFPHSSSSLVSVIGYDQVEISTATTITGSKTVLTTTNLVADSLTTNYNDTANSTGYYFARFKNSITSAFSSYSDPIPVGGYTYLTARAIIDKALVSINKSTSTTLPDAFAFSKIDDCQTEVLRSLKRWSFMQQFEYSLGQISTGQWRISLPANIDDNHSNKSIYNFKIGKGTNITWIDKEKWNEIIQGVAHTTLNTSIIVGASTIILDDASNFNPTSGTIRIGANTYAYSSLSGNTLTLSAVSTTTNTAGADVFQGASTGMPQYWTTYGGYLYFYPILASTQNLNDGFLDYYSTQVQITTDSSAIVIPDPTVIEYYLCWAFLVKQNNGEETEGSMQWYKKYEDRKNKMIQKETANRTFKLKPTLNRFNMSGDDPKSIRIGNFLQ